MDVKSLKTFLSTWAPVVEAIPAVIKAAEDLEYYQRERDMVKTDIANLLSDFDAVKSQWAQAESQWQGRLDELQKQIAAASTAVSEANAQAKKDIAAVNKRAKEAEAAAQERVERAKADAIAYEATAMTAAEHRIKEAQDRVAAVEADLAEAEKRYQITLKKIESLKASLGA